MSRHREYSLVLFVMALTITLSLASTVGNSVENSPLNENNIVYDLTAFVRGKQQKDTISIPHYVYLEGNVSTFCYDGNATVLKYEDVLNNPLPGNLGHMNITRSFMGFGNISNLLDMSPHTLTTKAPSNFANINSSTPPSLHISIYLRECKCSPSDIEMLLNLVEKSTVNGFSGKGIEYNDRFLECCRSHYFPAIGDVDYTILNVEVSPEDTWLSYEKFSDRMTHLAYENENFVYRYNFKCQQYIRLVSTNWNGAMSADQFARYEALHDKYFKRWAGENAGGDELYILRPIPENFIAKNDQYWQESVIPLTVTHALHDTIQNGTEILHSCASQQEYKVFSPALKNILLYHPSNGFLRSSQTMCPLSNMTTAELLRDRDISTSVVYDTQYLNVSYLSRLTSNLVIHSIYIAATEDFPTRSHVPQLLDSINSRNIQIGCITPPLSFSKLNSADKLDESITSLIKNQTLTCGPHLFNASKLVMIQFDLNQNIDLITFLANLHKLKQRFEQTYSGKTLVPVLRYNDTDASLFCDEESNFANEILDAVLSFANIHKWDKLVLGQNFPGLWNEFSREIEYAYGSDFSWFPFFYRLKTENLVDENLPFTFPCVKWKPQVWVGIDFGGNEHAGASLFVAKPSSWQGSRMTNAELDTALRVTLARFSLAEVIAADVQDLSQVTHVASGSLLPDIKRFRKLPQAHPPLVYVQVSLADVGALTPDVVASVNENKLAVHVRDWESPIDLLISPAASKAIGALSHFGLTVGNCGEMMKSTFANFTKFPLNKMVTFVVCDWVPFTLTRVSEKLTSDYLLGLYYAKYYIEKVLPISNGRKPNIEVIFRINVKGLERQCPVSVAAVYQNSYLSFLHMLNQFSAIHKIRYFVAHALGPAESFAQCPYTWWHINNYSDLSNLSVYKATEDEYFGRPTKLDLIPKVTSSEDASSSDHNHVYYISAAIVVAVVVVAASAVVALWLRNRFLLNQMLTQKEIKQFHDGVEMTGDEMEMLSKDLQDSMYKKFPKKFEVALSDIEKGELIGSGQFGLVHKGMIISKQIEIAIKIPRETCGKEQFLSTLSELKILAYIGSHDNVVSFMGAYTKEIGRGKLYVLTELCEKGALVGYLRELKRQQTERTSQLPVDMHTLCAFAHQIACGMDYVAEKRIIHGDLATRNVLLTADYTCKIADFGLSRRLYELNEYKKTSVEPMPWRWMAPESLGDMEFTTKSDVWSYGVTLWEIFSLGSVPYPGRTWSDGFVTEMQDGMRVEKAKFATDDIHDTMMNCWNLIPDARPSFKDLGNCFAEMNAPEYTTFEAV